MAVRSRWRPARGWWLHWIWLVVAGTAQAHKPSDSYLQLDVAGQTIEGRWDIAIRDLEWQLGLDRNADRRVTWGEIQDREPAIAGYALAHLQARVDGQVCDLSAGSLQIETHTDGAYVSLPLSGQCPRFGTQVQLQYDLMFDRDAQHRGLLRIAHRGQVETAVFTPTRRRQVFDLRETRATRVAWQYFHEGLWHVWIGLDHLLFLAGLLLPTVLRRQPGGFQVAESPGETLRDVLFVVTSFTMAHFVALSLATLGWLTLPSRWVESAVALTIVFAAMNNLVPVVTRRLWLVAFGFGLIHGAGYASVLSDLGLPPITLALALLAFNAGVEGAQIAVAAVTLPVAFWLRRYRWMQWCVLVPGALLVALLGVLWFLERALNQTVLT